MASYGTAPNQVGRAFSYNSTNPGVGSVYTVPAGCFAVLYPHFVASGTYWSIRKNGLSGQAVALSANAGSNPSASSGFIMGPGDQLYSNVSVNRSESFTVVETITAA